MTFRSTICLIILSLSYSAYGYASEPVSDDCQDTESSSPHSISSDCPLDIVCPPEDTIFRTCLPYWGRYLRDISPDAGPDFTDLQYFQDSLGGVLIASCEPIVLRLQDDSELVTASDCSMTKVVRRVIRIYDGNPNSPITNFERCTLLYKVDVPFTLAGRNPDTSIVVSCEGDIAGELNKLLSSNGYFKPSTTPCTSISVKATIPANPSLNSINYSCEGNGQVRLQWTLVDGCSYESTVSANFVVRDDAPPTVDCPMGLTLDISDNMLEEKITDHINLATIMDNCSSAPTLTNDFDIANVDFQSCLPEQIIVTNFFGIDDCGNTSSPCASTITIENSGKIEMTCPTDTLMLECGDTDNLVKVDTWFALNVSATDFKGQTIIDITDNFDDNSLNTTYCNQEFTVTFVAKDVCDRTADCTGRIIINDTTPPTVTNCPGDFVRDADNPNLVSEAIAWLAEYEATDSCNPSLEKNNDLDQSLLTANCGTINETVHFTANDLCNPIDSTCRPTLRINNNIVSVFSVFPNDTTVECSSQITTLGAEIDAHIRQAKGANNLGQTFTILNDFDVFDSRLSECGAMIEVRIWFTDLCGLEVEDFMTVTVADTTPPTIDCPGPGDFEGLFDDIQPDITNWLGSAVATDNCNIKRVATDYAAILFEGCDEEVTRDITFFAEDDCGNFSTSCTQMLTIKTEKSPRLLCPSPLNVECGDTLALQKINDWLGVAVATSPLGDTISHVNDFDVFGTTLISCLEEYEITFSTQIQCAPGMFLDAECFSTLKIEDTTSPTIACPALETFNSTDPNLDQNISEWLGKVTFDDNGCLGPAIDDNYDASLLVACDQNADLDITFVVEDQCGLTSSCIGRLSFNQSAPTLLCPAGLVLECNSSSLISDINDWRRMATATDNSDNTTVVNDDFDGMIMDSVCSQNILVTFTTMDVCGKESDCRGSIEIRDTESPVFVNGCPDPLFLLSGSPIADKQSSFEDWVNSIILDDCNTYDLTYGFDPSTFTVDCDDQNIMVPFTATDDCGWINSACVGMITISNNVNPTLNCASPTTVECAGPNTEEEIRTWLETASADDGLGNSFAVTNNFEFNNPDLRQCSGTIQVMFTMTNNCTMMSDDCMATLTITDTTDPIITCPDPAEFVLQDPTFDTQVDTWLKTVSAEDACISLLFYDNDYSTVTSIPDCQGFEDVDVTFSANDGCGNTVNCLQTLRITTTDIPMISCPTNDLTLECGDASIPADIQGWLTSTSGVDADGNDLQVTNDFLSSTVTDLNCDGMVEVKFEITDNCNITIECLKTIFVEDNTRPMAICPPSITINSTDANGMLLADDWFTGNDASDNCSNATASAEFGFAIPNNLCLADPLNEVEFYAVDECGMRDTCTSVLTINQDMPEINCPDDLFLQCGEPDNDLKIQDWRESFTGMDNSDRPLIVQDDFVMTSLSTDCNQTPVTFTFEVIDECNTPNNCQRSIIQRDTLAPVINSCPQDVEYDVETIGLDAEINTWLGQFSATDACNSATISWDYDIVLEDYDCGQDTVVQFVAVDECGNENLSCTARIDFTNSYVVDITCPDPIALKCNDPRIESDINSFLANYSYSPAEATPSNDFDLSMVDTECSGSFTEIITFTVTDECNNTHECMTSIDFIPAASLYIPTIFNPSSSGDDTSFRLYSNTALIDGEETTIISIRHFAIYSRWGDLMFERNNFDPNTEPGWDGRNRLGNHVQGVYTYKLEYEDIFGNETEKIGTITLID